MKITQPGQARAMYYDRNVTRPAGLTFLGNAVAPHGSTSRVSYTAPAGRKAYVELVYTRSERQTAAAPSGLAGILATGTTINYADDRRNNNTVNDKEVTVETSVGLVLPAEAIIITTEDASTGGTYRYSCQLKIAEFDA